MLAFGFTTFGQALDQSTCTLTTLGQASRVAAAQQRLLEGGASPAVPLLTDGREGGRGPPLAQRLRLQPGEGTNPLPTEVCFIRSGSRAASLHSMLRPVTQAELGSITSAEGLAGN